MTLPARLLQAISSPDRGKIALVVGAGCSVEAPTGIPATRELSLEIHRRLLEDGVLQNGDCSDPGDLSLVADAVFAKTGFQRDVVERLCEQYDLKLATPNDGYLIAAALLCEGTISSVITLNFDLALSHALAELGAGNNVGVIECPDDLSRQKIFNVYYLHRNANAADPESWVLRTAALRVEWKGHWEPIITTKVLTAPVVVFAGLGTPVTVLVESTRLLRHSLPSVTKIYQVDPADRAASKLFQELALDPSDYIRCGWCAFMEQLSERLLTEHVSQLKQAVDRKFQEDRLQIEDVGDLLARLKSLGLVKSGKLRALWLLHDREYYPLEPNALGLIADLLTALAMVARVSHSVAVICEDGITEFQRDGRAVVSYLVASGRGHRTRSAVEADVEHRHRRYRGRVPPPTGVIVSGTSDTWTTTLTPPADVVRGNVSESIVVGPQGLPLFHIGELRADPSRIQQVVP
jgi:hypothetical protein